MSVMESRPAKHDLPAFHEDKKIILRDSDNVFIIKKEDILYISGNGFYSAISFILGGKHKSVVISKPLSKVEAEYHYNTFYRVHKSYIINVENIEKISKEAGLTIKMKDGKLITVAKRRIHDFYSFLNNAG
jgi:two-component system LytT family response regulator